MASHCTVPALGSFQADEVAARAQGITMHVGSRSFAPSTAAKAQVPQSLADCMGSSQQGVHVLRAEAPNTWLAKILHHPSLVTPACLKGLPRQQSCKQWLVMHQFGRASDGQVVHSFICSFVHAPTQQPSHYCRCCCCRCSWLPPPLLPLLPGSGGSLRLTPFSVDCRSSSARSCKPGGMMRGGMAGRQTSNGARRVA